MQITSKITAIAAWFCTHKDDVFRFLESVGGAAAITVVLGGLVGGLLNACVQRSLLDREHAVVAYQNRLDRERRNIEQMYQLIGESVVAAENLIGLTESSFDPENYSDEAAVAVTQQRLALIREYNALDAQWRIRQYLQDLQVAYYDESGYDTVIEEWDSVEGSVSDLRRCAENLFSQYNSDRSTDTTGACEAQKETAILNLRKLTVTLSAMSRGLLYPGGTAP